MPAEVRVEHRRVLGMSPDSQRSHDKFKSKHGLSLDLVSDEEKKALDAYGVWGEKQLYGRKYMGLHRTTFLIDEKGIIRKVFLRPKNKQHAEEIIKAWELIDADAKK